MLIGTRMTPKVRTTGVYLGVAIAVLFSPMSAKADMIFTDRPTFLSALSSSFTETFESLTPGSTLPNNTAFSGNGFSFTAAGGPAGLFAFLPNPSGSTVSLSTADVSAATLTFSFAPGTVNAVGGDFFLADFNNDPYVGPVTITLSNGTMTTFSSTTAPPYPFRGFIADAGFLTSLTMSAAAYNAADNFVVGLAGVPEPSSFVLCGLGAASVIFFRLRRKQVAVGSESIA